jgi:hypothetical protein
MLQKEMSLVVLGRSGVMDSVTFGLRANTVHGEYLRLSFLLDLQLFKVLPGSHPVSCILQYNYTVIVGLDGGSNIVEKLLWALDAKWVGEGGPGTRSCRGCGREKVQSTG